MPRHRISMPATTGRAAGRAVALGAFATGALAVGAVAIGALAIRRLYIRRAAMTSLDLGKLTIGRLELRELTAPISSAGTRKDMIEATAHFGPQAEPVGSDMQAKPETDGNSADPPESSPAS